MGPIRHWRHVIMERVAQWNRVREEPTRGPVELESSAGLGWAKARGFVCCGEGFIISPSGGVSTPALLPANPRSAL